MADHQLTFLGLTKTQFIGVLVTLLALLAASLSLLVFRYTALAEQGAESHKALCVLKHDYSQRLASSEAFEKMTVARRVKKYGSALGHIPAGVIQQSQRSLQTELDSLSTLKCN